ncbi:MAG: hypothetical protein ABW019_17355 [Chitinophagaceae bacterium]
MKLASLFAQYLYTHHRLDLPGIGTFHLDPAVITTLENTRQRSAMAEGISFDNNPATRESPELITFISAHTGKMKALASSDLESHLQLAQQFLNIGKPFVLDGIGTLVKKKPGELEFVPLSVSAEKIKQNKTQDTAPAAMQEPSAPYEPFIDAPPRKGRWKKPVFAVLILLVAGLAFWGAYTVYHSPAPETTDPLPDAVNQPAPQQPAPDTTHTPVAVPKAAVPEYYDYILETPGKERALRRYAQLKKNGSPVQLETRDSIRFKLFVRIPAANADTAHIADSLRILYGKPIYIEQ